MALTVVDSIMGSGKTSWAIQTMLERPQEKFLYVTPYLNECDRIVEACGSERFRQPHDREGMTKLEDLKGAMAEGKSVATTHELFKRIDREVLELVVDHGYILILDEVIDVIRPVIHQEKLDPEQNEPEYADWVRALLEHGVLLPGKPLGDGTAMQLLPGPEARLGLGTLRRFAEEGRLVMVNSAMLVWLFPTDCFNSFKEIYNLTYLFQGQAQKAYFDIQGIPYSVRSVAREKDRYALVPWSPELDREAIDRARGFIRLYEGPANDIGWQTGKSKPLSKTWYIKNRKLGRQVMTSAENWLKRNAKARGEDTIWTVFKPIFGGGRLAPRSYKKAWISTTTRSTNEYRERRAVAYLVNVFFRVPVSRFLTAMGVQLNEDLFALSEMIQFIWRSRIRDGKPIDLFIPSGRMRRLLTSWLEGELGNAAESSLPESEAA